MSSLPQRSIDSLVEAYKDDTRIKLPARLSKIAVTADDRAKYLDALLSHDPGVFLERHGKLLSQNQRQAFEPLKDSYEVDFYMKLLEGEEQAEPTAAENGPPSSIAKNRRLAKMARLAKEGYFDEDVARQRAPLLHHHYFGSQGNSTQPKPRANTLHDQIIQQHEEQEIKARLAAQQEAEDAAGEAFEATLSESEPESEDDEDLELPKYEKHQPQLAVISESEMRQNKEEFRAIMEARFLNGEDGGREADQDASLDDDWTKERTQDIEDKYFET